MTDSILSAGTGIAEIELPDSVFPIEKFEQILDPLHVRALILKSNITVAFLSVEMTSLQPYAIEKARLLTADFLQIPVEHVWLGVTHTFSAPHTRSEKALSNADETIRRKNAALCTAFYEALLSALRSARDSLQEVRLRFGSASCPVNVNRDVEMAEGWWLGADAEGFSDHFVRSLCIEQTNGSLMAVLFSYDVQSSTLDGIGGLISSDLAGRASSYLEKEGCPAALFFLGGAGDQAPVPANMEAANIREERIAHKESSGILVGKALKEAVSHAQALPLSRTLQCTTLSLTCPAQVLPENMRDLKPTHSWQYKEDGERDTSFSLITYGDLALIAVKPELCSKTAHSIREMSPYPHTMVFTMVNGAEKYMADEQSYSRYTYEAMNSMYGRGSAELLEQKILSFLREHR